MIKNIAIVSLSRGILGEPFVKWELDLGLKRLNEYGINVKFMSHALSGIDYVQEHPEKRAEDLIAAFRDDDIDMILCAIGGDDTYRLLPHLFENDELKQAVKQKIFLGFSDTTMNHFMLHKLGIKTFYGQAFMPDVCEFSSEMLPYTRHYFEELITTGQISEITPSPVWYEAREIFNESELGKGTPEHTNNGFELLQGSPIFEGKILGGCIDTIFDMFDNERYADSVELCEKYKLFPSREEWQGCILLLETSEEKMSPQKYEKALLEMKKRGVFDAVSGVLIGKPMNKWNFDEYKQLLVKVIDNPSLPIVCNINIGHAMPRCIIPFGVHAVVDANKQTIAFQSIYDKIEESAMAVVFCNGRILATNELIYGSEKISLPKGHVEENEKSIEASIRECYEETNIEITEANLVKELIPYSYEFLTPSNKLVKKTLLPYLFEIKNFGSPIPKEERMISVEWMSVRDFMQSCSYENVKTVVTEALEAIRKSTRLSAYNGDRNAQYNLAWFHEDGIGVERDMEQAIFWYRKAALQDHDLAKGKCKELGVDLNAPTIDRDVIRKALECRIYPLGYLERYKYTVICTSYDGKWILSRHKKRNTWETQGGHIEDGETPLECAKRELFEESGIEDADIYPVCDYWGFNSQACSNGMVFLAVVHSLGELPESEMKEIKIFDTLPSELTYPQTSPKLYAEAEKVLKTLEQEYI